VSAVKPKIKIEKTTPESQNKNSQRTSETRHCEGKVIINKNEEKLRK